jgi:hypothetical protein
VGYTTSEKLRELAEAKRCYGTAEYSKKSCICRTCKVSSLCSKVWPKQKRPPRRPVFNPSHTLSSEELEEFLKKGRLENELGDIQRTFTTIKG